MVVTPELSAPLDIVYVGGALYVLGTVSTATQIVKVSLGALPTKTSLNLSIANALAMATDGTDLYVGIGRVVHKVTISKSGVAPSVASYNAGSTTPLTNNLGEMVFVGSDLYVYDSTIESYISL